jgi:hypothetical protein
MKNSSFIGSVTVGLAWFVFSNHLIAATIQTLGADSAVTAVDRAATFSSITSNGIPLSDYIEGQLFIGANADSLVGYDSFGGKGSDPYFYCLEGGSMGGAVDSCVRISTTDSTKIFGV